jgi:DNA-directed RNA polymerase specialized sigma24 family protein
MPRSFPDATLERVVPRLRRYARASLGDRAPADDCVARALEALHREDPARRPSETALYRAVHRELRREPVAADASGRLDEASMLAEAIRALAPAQAHALLLRRLEGLDPERAAVVMDVSAGEVERLSGEALAALRRRFLARVLIIEDDFLLAEHIAAVLTDLGHAVTGVAATVEEAVACARRRRPDVVLADVQLRGRGSGIDAIAAIRTAVPIRTIYVTAYPERVFGAGTEDAALLVTKPFDDLRLKTAMMAALGQADREPAR